MIVDSKILGYSSMAERINKKLIDRDEKMKAFRYWRFFANLGMFAMLRIAITGRMNKFRFRRDIDVSVKNDTSPVRRLNSTWGSRGSRQKPKQCA